jgi:hypothetical protein
MKKTYLSRIVLMVFILATLVTSCRKDKKISPTLSAPTRAYSSDQLRNYYTLMCTIIRSTKGFFPPQAARAYGYVGIATYESVVYGIPGAMSLYGQVNGLTVLPKPNTMLEYNWAISSNAAVAEMIRKMFDVNLSAANLATIDSTETANLAALSRGQTQDVIDRSVQFGKDVTAAIYTASTTDGGHQAYTNPFQLPYTPPVGPADWVPTSATLTPVAPKWGSNRPFILANVTSNEPASPTAFGTDVNSAFYLQAIAVYNQVKNNSADQVTIAKFWADDPFNTCTPTGHTFNIMTQLLKENNATLEKSSVAFAKLAIAENDAFIICWKGKYQYTLIRPVSYIKKYIDPAFATVIGTPAFPSYTSGHSADMGAGSMMFTNLFTDGSGNYTFTDYSQLQYGFAARNYTNFNDMALECANSRFYAGIHYDQDNQEGLKMGRTAADNVNKMITWPANIR